MSESGYVSASGASVKMRDLDVVANNLANVNTPGFKRNESIFRAVLESSLRDAAGARQPGAGATSFVKTDRVGADFAPGSAVHTGSPLHAMIDGPGFFEVQFEGEGRRFTRAGNFVINRQGFLALPSGEPVLGAGGPIAVPSGDAQISPNGVVQDGQGTILGRLALFAVEDRQALTREGQSLFHATDEIAVTSVAEPSLIPESIEGSNVQPARELATLVMLQRAFESNMRALQTDDQTTQRLIEGIR